MNTKRWTKADIRRCCSCISTWWLLNDRPPWARCVEHVNRYRLAIVLAGLRDAVARDENYAARDTECADHARTHPTVWGASTPEMIARFESHAADARKGAARIAALIARLESEGLPAEVDTFDPEQEARR